MSRLILILFLVWGLPVVAWADSSPLRVSLEEAIAGALSHHPTARAAAATEAKARARLESVRAASLPTLTTTLIHVREDSHILSPSGVHAALAATRVDLSLGVPLVAPRAWASWLEAHEDVAIGVADAQAERRRVALGAARAWAGVATATHVVAARQEALEHARAHLEFVRGRQSAGAATLLDVVRAEREVASATALLEDSASHRERAGEALGVWLAVDQSVDVSLESESALMSAAGQTGGDEELPELRAAAHAKAAAQRALDDSFTDFLPTLRLDAFGFFQDQPTPPLPVTGIGYVAQLTVSMAIYDGGARYAALRVRRADKLRTAAHFEELHRALTSEQRTLSRDREHASLALSEIRRSAELARSALLLTKQRFSSGVGSGLDVIDALRQSRDADIAVAQAQETLRLVCIELLFVRGLLPSPSLLRSNH